MRHPAVKQRPRLCVVKICEESALEKVPATEIDKPRQDGHGGKDADRASDSEPTPRDQAVRVNGLRGQASPQLLSVGHQRTVFWRSVPT